MTAIDPIQVSRRDAAHMLGVSERRVDELRAEGELETRYEGSRPLVTVESIRRYASALPSRRIEAS